MTPKHLRTKTKATAGRRRQGIFGGELFAKIGTQVQGAGTFRQAPPIASERFTGFLPPQAIPGPIRPEAANPAISWGERGRERAYP